MNVIDVADLKDQLDKFTDWLATGEVVQITRDGMPFAYATPNSLISSGEQIKNPGQTYLQTRCLMVLDFP